jgi:hypothetical protein
VIVLGADFASAAPAASKRDGNVASRVPSTVRLLEQGAFPFSLMSADR